MGEIIHGESGNQRDPEQVVRELREFNFFFPNDTVAKVVQKVKDQAGGEAGYGLRVNEPAMLDIIADELEAAGYAKLGSLNRSQWTDEFESVLTTALADFEAKSPELKEETFKSIKNKGI